MTNLIRQAEHFEAGARRADREGDRLSAHVLAAWAAYCRQWARAADDAQKPDAEEDEA